MMHDKNDEIIEIILYLYDNNYTAKEIGKIVKMHRITVMKKLKLHGGKSRYAGRKYDLTGNKYGFIEVLKYTGPNLYLCKCKKCGIKKEIRGNQLKIGRYKSCGCNKYTLYGQYGYEKMHSSFFNHYKIGAKNRNLEFDITPKDVWDLYIKQKSRCKLTNVAIRFSIRSRLNTVSIDRIDSDKGYTLDNIQLVHKDINKMKFDLTQTKFIQWCKLIAANN